MDYDGISTANPIFQHFTTKNNQANQSQRQSHILNYVVTIS